MMATVTNMASLINCAFIAKCFKGIKIKESTRNRKITECQEFLPSNSIYTYLLAQ